MLSNNQYPAHPKMSSNDALSNKKKKSISSTPTKESINYFKKIVGGGRNENDGANKVRENAIVMMLNKKVPDEYLLYDLCWGSVAELVQICVNKMLKNSGVDSEKIVYKKAAGRGKHHDFEAVMPDGTIIMKIEFKHGASQITEAPQFVSPMKPSQYMTESFESFFYDTGLFEIMGSEFAIPDKTVWMAQVHGNKPPCMKMFQDKYYAGCRASSQFTGDEMDILFYEKCKAVADESIVAFLARDEVTLRQDILSAYFIQTQEKVYLMYKDGEFTHQHIDPEEFVIETCKKEPEKHRFVVTTRTGRTLIILLRWKNGNGIAFPAFQISLVDR